jgi:cell division protein FtsN
MKALRPLVLVAALLAALSCAVASDSGKTDKTYMWIDKHGQRQYGDAVPPEYAQTERRVLNRQGVETSTEGSRKNAQQLAEEQRVLDGKREREQRDRFLLNTYASTRDIERLRDERLLQLEGQIRATTAYVETLDTRLTALVERSMIFKPYSDKANARRMPDDVAEQLVRNSNEAAAQRKAVDKQRQDAQQVRVKFDDDIARFRELSAKLKNG